MMYFAGQTTPHPRTKRASSDDEVTPLVSVDVQMVFFLFLSDFYVTG